MSCAYLSLSAILQPPFMPPDKLLGGVAELKRQFILFETELFIQRPGSEPHRVAFPEGRDRDIAILGEPLDHHPDKRRADAHFPVQGMDGHAGQASAADGIKQNADHLPLCFRAQGGAARDVLFKRPLIILHIKAGEVFFYQINKRHPGGDIPALGDMQGVGRHWLHGGFLSRIKTKSGYLNREK